MYNTMIMISVFLFSLSAILFVVGYSFSKVVQLLINNEY